jgi:cytochrome bd-type quinol oxidase subunit 2
MTGLILAALFVVGGIAWLALRGTPGAQVPAVVATLTRAVVVLVLVYVALRLVSPEDIPVVLRDVLRYLRA